MAGETNGNGRIAWHQLPFGAIFTLGSILIASGGILVTVQAHSKDIDALKFDAKTDAKSVTSHETRIDMLQEIMQRCCVPSDNTKVFKPKQDK